ncbi:MAG: hypothetical protein U0U25_15020 [Flavobacteriales bacterium]
MRVVLMALLCLMGCDVRAQWSDTSRTHDVRDKPRFIFNFDARRQDVQGDVVRFFGIRAGMQERYNIYALGLYGLGDPFVESGVVLEDVGQRNLDIRTSMGYISGTYERILLDGRHWQISTPFMAGIGEASVEYRDSSGVFLPYRSTRLYPLETGVRTSFKLLFWLYLQGGLGYRRVLGPSPLVNKEYTGVTWNFGLSIKLGKIYRYAKDKLEERRERNATEDGAP